MKALSVLKYLCELSWSLPPLLPPDNSFINRLTVYIETELKTMLTHSVGDNPEKNLSAQEQQDLKTLNDSLAAVFEAESHLPASYCRLKALHEAFAILWDAERQPVAILFQASPYSAKDMDLCTPHRHVDASLENEYLKRHIQSFRGVHG